MKKLAFLIITIIAISGCVRIQTPNVNTIYGNWYTKSYKKISSNTTAYITKKEQFFRNGTLVSSKWFNFRDSRGNNLGEYYITKLFKYKRDRTTIEAKFIKCSTGITKPLKVNNLGHKKLANICRNKRASYKVTKKRYRVYNNILILGGVKYIKE